MVAQLDFVATPIRPRYPGLDYGMNVVIPASVLRVTSVAVLGLCFHLPFRLSPTTTFVVLAAEPADGAYIMLLQVVLVGEADAEALDNILNTFQVIGAI